MKERDPFEDLGADGNIILKFIIEKQGVIPLTVFIWFRIGTSDGLL
jgi:hypothetical protein